MSEQTDQNVEHIKKGYEAFAEGDVETLMSLLDDNIEWIQPGDSAVSGTYHGKGELGDLLGRLAEKSPTISPAASWPTVTRSRAQRHDCRRRNSSRRRGVHPPRRQDGTGGDVWRHGDDGTRIRQEAGGGGVVHPPTLYVRPGERVLRIGSAVILVGCGLALHLYTTVAASLALSSVHTNISSDTVLAYRARTPSDRWQAAVRMVSRTTGGPMVKRELRTRRRAISGFQLGGRMSNSDTDRSRSAASAHQFRYAARRACTAWVRRWPRSRRTCPGSCSASVSAATSWKLVRRD